MPTFGHAGNEPELEYANTADKAYTREVSVLIASWAMWAQSLLLHPAILCFVMIFNASASAGQYDEYKVALYQALVDSTLLDSTYASQFKKTFLSILAGHLSLPIKINKPYHNGSLNIFVINTSGRDLMRTRTNNEWVKAVIQRSPNNAFAFDRDLLVFDSAFIADLMLNAYNDTISLVQAVGETENNRPAGMSEDEVADVMGRFSTISDRLRFRNIENSITRTDAEHLSIKYLPIMMKTLDKYVALDMMKLSLAPVVLHELGHLASQASGPFWMYAVQPTDDNRAVLAAEEAADAYANTHLRVLLSKAMVKGEGTQHVQTQAAIQAAIATAKFMRDKILFEAFSGFRGLAPEDLFTNLIHWDCRERPDTKSLGFDDLGKVKTGSFGFTPLLTSQEFASIREKLLKHVRSGTHSHHFLRADRMLAMIQEVGGWKWEDSLLGSQLLLLDSVLKNDPKEVAPQVEGKTGLSFETLTNSLGMQFQPAVNCPVEECWIGTFDNGRAGFLEIVGPNRDIRYARLIIPMFGSEPFVELSRRKDVEGYIMMMVVFMSFLSNVTQLEWTEGDWHKLLDDIRKQAFECGAVTRFIPLKNRNLIVRTVNERGWMSFEVEE